MADHVREQIAAAAVVAVTGLTTTGARVYRDRDTEARPLQAAEVPGLTLSDDGDPSEIVTLGLSRILERRMRLTVQAHVKASSGYGASLNQIAKEVEIALAGAWSSAMKYCTIAEIGQREVSESADLPIVRQSFNFEVVYYTANGAPDVAL